ncbi:serine kinase [Maribius pontilimi]|uniref:Serine kinase n=1 Tax=Palleronia pontilimi TaxID=1964209 RepID=A0A934MEM4_9RHOB|nr:serine kinase [Palleronia pontilimi]MBJ3763591.1 serine kinase [Palleronia pontilimi]
MVAHASAAALDGSGVLILGASGTGKSRLALGLLAHGFHLVADDRTCLGRRGADLIAWAPASILGRIEARGVGILNATPAPPTRIRLVVDLDRDEPDRLPPHRTWSARGWTGPLVHGRGNPDLLWAILQYLKAGRADRP